MKPALAILILLLSQSLSGFAALSDELRGKLVKLDPASGELRPWEFPAAQKPRYFMIYFSAHWCPPCRKLTPTLVNFYQATKPDHPEFEFIIASADRSAEAMLDYLREAEIPWPVLAWDERDAVAAIRDLDPRSIPFMAMLDSDGRLLGASDLGGFHVGIPKLINGLQEKLGIEPYDIEERHGGSATFTVVAYALAAGFVLIYILRRRCRRPRT